MPVLALESRARAIIPPASVDALRLVGTVGPLMIFALGRLFLSWRLDDARRRPLIVANPLGDVEFRRLIDRFLLEGRNRPDELQAALRDRYPEAVVRPRELANEGFEVWYAYRDGHWIRSEEHD